MKMKLKTRRKTLNNIPPIKQTYKKKTKDKMKEIKSVKKKMTQL